VTADNPGSGGWAGVGRARQNAIYRAGVLGRKPVVPTDAEELERRARRAMSRTAWAYVAGGAGSGTTMKNNREAFERHRIVPRMLHGVVERDLSTTLLGVRHRSPLLVAPVGAADLIRADSDVLIAQGARAAEVGYVFSNQGGSPMERTATAMGSTPFWYQLYWSSDEALVDSLIARAEA
jgi:lactate 2-monooxygenase